MAKSTTDTFRDLLGGITDDLKEAFDDIIDYDEYGRRGHRGQWDWRGDHWRQREDDGRWHRRHGDRWDDDRWSPRESGSRLGPPDGYEERERWSPRVAGALPRQSQRQETAGRDVAEDLRDLRTDLTAVVDALHQATVALNRSAAGEETTRN